MILKPLGIDGAWTVIPQVHDDRRGSFREWFRAEEFTALTGYRFPLAQANCSVSVKGAIRGIHFADVPPGQAKYVTCASGVALDVIVDVRAGSPTFGKSAAVPITAVAGNAVFLSEGLGHSWMALTETATLVYLCSRPYAPDSERAVNALDPALGIAWPLDGKPLMSERDTAAFTLDEALGRGMLPSYPECMAYQAALRA